MNHDQSHTPTPVTCTPRRGLVSLLRSVAGAPAGWRPSRRGSFLVLVVGTLALLAVMAVVYTTIGNHDARMQHASDKREKLDDVPQQVADYIARLIGEDTLSVGYSTNKHVSGGFIPLERKISDYPATSWQARSDKLYPTGVTTANPAYPFSPTGSVTGFITSPDLTALNPTASTGNPLSMPRFWEPTSPFLAATEPTFLNYNSVGPTYVDRPYIDLHDWAHISNIAPDGYYVNLFNMRGNFDAHGLTNAANPIPVMSQNLSLYAGNGQPGSLNPDFSGSVTVDPHVPAYFDSRQQWLFRPARPTPGNNNGPNRPTFDPYQFADADGDGMYDSRWQELNDLRGLAAVLSGVGGNNNGAITSILHTDGKIRYFVAARIIDASSMVNVNTAADMHEAPKGHMPAGATPAEIDLWRILRMRDSYDLNGFAAGLPSGYDGLFQPVDDVPGKYAGVTGDTGYDRGRAQIVGDYAYAALRVAQAGGSIPPASYRSTQLITAFPADFNFNTDGPGLEGWDNYTPTNYANNPYLGFRDPVLRAQYYANRAGSFDGTSFQGSVPGANPPVLFSTSTFTSSFGLDDLLELVARRTVNNPQYTSQLEATLDGRDDFTGPPTFPNTMRFGVLRSNRPLEVEHDTRYRFPLTGAPPTAVGSPYDITMLHFASDVRQRLTTYNGGRDFRMLPGELDASGHFFPSVSSDQLLGADSSDRVNTELRVDPRVAMEVIKTVDALTTVPTQAQLAQKSEAINSIFQAYANALLPTSAIRDPVNGSPWNSASPGYANRMTEFYGHQGPELALHVAAHMTMNFMGMYNSTGVPAVHTLVLSNNANTVLAANPTAFPACDSNYYPPGNKHSLRPLQLSIPRSTSEPGRLGDVSQGDTIMAPAVNIYAVEPQPFLTQVAAFTVYADSAHNMSNPNSDDEPVNSDFTIKGDIDFQSNHDVICRVVAFQLTNPFGVDITLGGAPTIGGVDTGVFDVTDPQYPRPDREGNFYYIRFGGKVFKIADMQEATDAVSQLAADTEHTANRPALPPPGSTVYQFETVYDATLAADAGIHLKQIKIPAGKSIACYVISDIPRRILTDRMAHLGEAGSTVERYFNSSVNGFPILQDRTLLKRAIEHQLNGDVAANAGDIDNVYWIPQIDVDVTNPTAGTGQVVLPQSTNLFGSARIGVVELWRSARYGMENTPQTIRLPGVEWDGITAPPPPSPNNPTFTPPNDFTNDQLMDRLRIPSGGVTPFNLDDQSRLANGPHGIAGTRTIPDTDKPKFVYTIETHASVRRKGDPRPNNAKPPLGAIPGYCIEPKYDTNWNLTESSSDLATLSDPDFNAASPGASFKGGAPAPREWFTKMRNGRLDHYQDFHMWQSLANNIVDTAAPNIVPDIDPDNAAAVAGVGQPYSDHYPQINIDNNEFHPNPKVPPPNPLPTPYVAPAVSTLRPGDMLLPLGIGPEEMPFYYAGPTATAAPDNEVRWTTLGEALALALGYQTNTATAPAIDSASVYTPSTYGTRTVLDRGNLRLDDYIPYISLNGPPFDPATCERLGNQIPLALNVLDVFTISPSRSVTASNNKQVLEYQVQSLTHGTRGKLNINTVPLNTLRPGIDLFSPPPPSDLNNQTWWWWQTDPATGAQPLLNERVDIAPTVIAYRDKGTQFVRPNTRGPANGAVAFDDLDSSGQPVFPNNTLQLMGRTGVTQIGQTVAGTPTVSPLHEQPGFRTIGELMNVRFRDSTDPASNAYGTNMDWMAHDDLPPAPGVPTVTPPPPPQSLTLYRAGASGHVGLDSILYRTDATPTNNLPDHPSAVPNNYTEQLEIINGVLNNVSNRSDVFVAWFQIQGYKQSDVENLGDDDPMTPSVNRRFVMVIDRSKVTRRGQSADILLFKEVPVDPEPKAPVP